MPGSLYNTLLRPSKMVRLHVLCWIIFITYELSTLWFISVGFRPASFYLCFYTLNIGMFYFQALVVLHPREKYTLTDGIRIPLLIVFALLAYLFISILISTYLKNESYEQLKATFFNHTYFGSTVWRGTYFMLYGTGYSFLIRYNQKKERAATHAIENEKLNNKLLRAEQDFLRAQINPHLLFNTLNFIKYAVRKRPDEADQAIMRLSGLMDFALENNSTTIPLNKELEQVENIIMLNQLRYNHTLNISYKTEIHDMETPVIPLILLTLVENIFKHGNLLEEDHPAEIRIESTPEYLLFQTCNFPGMSRAFKSGKTGLKNIDLRLRQFYPDNYRFSYGLEGNVFKVEAKINYKNN